MEFNFNEILATVVPQLGFGVIFLWLFFQEKKENRENIANRDSRIKELTEQLIDINQKTIEVLTQFKDAVNSNTNAMQVNNNSIQGLSEKISTLIAGGIPSR